jgi:hypothetical protein
VTVDRVRYGRQIRLPEIGEAGQERLGASEVALGGRGDAREIETSYLRAAGVRVSEASVALTSPPAALPLGPAEYTALLGTLGVQDRAARDVADGALRALLAMRALVGVGASGG